MTFEEFALEAGPQLRAGLVAAYGPVVGADAAAAALAYGWEHWDRLSRMDNPTGYLFRVGQSDARRSRRRQGHLPVPTHSEIPEFEPGLVPALELLSANQRVAVLMVHALGWSQADTARVLDISPSSVRTHLARGIEKLKRSLEATRCV